MKIGIGVTTHRRPRHLQHCLTQIRKYSPTDALVYITDDTRERRGVYYRKNRCLRALYEAGCDYFFLLDDDCFPIADGWCQHYITASQRTGQEVLLYNSRSKDKLEVRNGLELVYGNVDALLFLTRKAVETVGGFNLSYRLYGWGFQTYLIRAWRAGLTTHNAYLHPLGAEQYVYALDLDSYLPINQQLQHRSSMAPKERQELLQLNRRFMVHDRKIHQPF